MARAKNPNSKTAQAKRSASAKRGAATKAYNRDAAAATAQREQHEAEHPEHYRDVYSLTGSENLRGQVSQQHMYHLMNWHGASDSPHVVGQQELPGMEHPDALPTPRRWEDYSEDEQKAVRKAAGRFGVTEESAHRALGAQIDQANLREGGVHHSFYSSEGTSESGANMPRTQVRTSAEANGVSFGVQAMANAMTSPNNRFVQRPKSGPRKGEVVYPNDEAASHAIQWSQEGLTGEQYLHHPDFHVPNDEKVLNPRTNKLEKPKGDSRKYPVQGYPVNHARAVDAVTAVREGASVREAWGADEKTTGRADYGDPKTAPFHNSWVDPHGSNQFWVSDTHSGPAAFAPHLRGKQEDQYMGIDGIHAFHDHIARQVMAERGLNSLSGMQSQHWSQEKFNQGHASDVAEMRPVDTTKRESRNKVFQGQGTLF